MYLSKLWIFMITVVAVSASIVAVLMPRPADRKVLDTEDSRLGQAQWGVNMLLRENSRNWMDLASSFARSANVDKVLGEATRSATLQSKLSKTGRDVLKGLMKQVEGDQTPDFAFAVDAYGRALASVGRYKLRHGDDMSGLSIMRDVLRGYVRDDLWYEDGKLYRVAASPVIDRVRGNYVGAIVIGGEVDASLAEALDKGVHASVAFFANGESIAASSQVNITKEVQAQVEAASKDADADGQDRLGTPFNVLAANKSYRVVISRTPGEAGAQGGLYAVFSERPPASGFSGSFRLISKDDIGSLWIVGAIMFLVAVALGIGLTWLEGDRPLKRLVEDALAVGNGDAEKLNEFQNKGKYGSIARSVNIALDKINRALDKASNGRGQDLGSVLGPPPRGGIGTTELPATPPPGGQLPAGVFSPPPPSDFSFGAPPPPVADLAPPMAGLAPPVADLAPPPVVAPPAAIAPPPARAFVRAATPPPVPDLPSFGGMTPPPEPEPPPPPAFSPDPFDDATVIGEPSESLLQAAATGGDPDDAYFREVHQQFVELKTTCGENTDGLTLDSFASKLRKNRDQLIAKYGCQTVKFKVYVKDGKAALKATPVKA